MERNGRTLRAGVVLPLAKHAIGGRQRDLTKDDEKKRGVIMRLVE
jgi:hypothetical protein